MDLVRWLRVVSTFILFSTLAVAIPAASAGGGLLPGGEIIARPQVASWVGSWHAGRPMANGQPYDPTAFTCAHKELRLGTVLRVSTLDGRIAVRLVVADRGPYIEGRDLDVSQAAAQVLGFERAGVSKVHMEVLRGA